MSWTYGVKLYHGGFGSEYKPVTVRQLNDNLKPFHFKLAHKSSSKRLFSLTARSLL